jgi:hypothetical protein
MAKDELSRRNFSKFSRSAVTRSSVRESKKILISVFVLVVSLSSLQAGIVKGRIVDPNGDPVSDVGITIAPFRWVVYTDSAGSYSTPTIAPGTYVLKAQRFGWVSQQDTVTMPVTDLLTLNEIVLSFGDMDNNGVIDLRDVVLMSDSQGDSVTNVNRYLDLDGNGIIDSVDFDEQLIGFNNTGKAVDEWMVSRPDFITFIPSAVNSSDGTNQHDLVSHLPTGRLFGLWTQGYEESGSNQSVVCHWSDDGGTTWSDPKVIDGPQLDGRIASWGFFVVVPAFHRIYVFYNKDVGTRIYQTGQLEFKYSDDWGENWSSPFVTSFRRGAYSPTDTTIPPSWWVYQNPIIVGGKPIVGFTEFQSRPPDIFYTNEIRFLQFDNILEEPDPSKIQITTYPTGSTGLRGSYLANTSQSTLQEPSLVQLSDGRLFCVMRSGQGFPRYSLSVDSARTWKTPAPLRYHDGGSTIDQPLAPCPIYQMGDGNYALVSFNNKGDANGGQDASDGLKNRTPAFLLIGRESRTDSQAIVFSEPIRLLENFVRPCGPQSRTEIGSYPSLTDEGDHYVLWYPDRKYFLLGKKIPKPITRLLGP